MGLGIFDATFLIIVGAIAIAAAVIGWAVKRHKAKTGEGKKAKRTKTKRRKYEKTHEKEVEYVDAPEIVTEKKVEKTPRKVVEKTYVLPKDETIVEHEVINNNYYHTPNNYDAIYDDNELFVKVENKKDILKHALASGKFMDKENPQGFVEEQMEKLDHKCGIEHENEVTPDYVFEAEVDGEQKQDRRNYIQIFDERYATSFQECAKECVDINDKSKPQVAKFDCGEDLKPLYVSSTDQKTYDVGCYNCYSKIVELVDDKKITKETFPIKVTEKNADGQSVSYYNSKEDILDKIEEIKSKYEEEPEKEPEEDKPKDDDGASIV